MLLLFCPTRWCWRGTAAPGGARLRLNTKAISSLAPTPISFASRSGSAGVKPGSISTVERGTQYEEHVVKYLHNALPGVQLTRVGGANDGGIDASGWWWLRPPSDSADASSKATSKSMPASIPDRIRILVQCKAEAKKLGPIHIREIQGAYASRYGEPTTVPDDDSLPASPAPVRTAVATSKSNVAAIGVLASSSGFSKQCIMQAMSCPVPLILVYLVHPLDVSADNSSPVRRASSSSLPSRTTPETPAPIEATSLLVNDALQRDLFKDFLSVQWITRPPARRRQGSLPITTTETPTLIPKILLGLHNS